jgi:hypothetical protein
MILCSLFQNPVGQINMRDARVEEVDHVSDSDSEDQEGDGHTTELTIGIFPTHQGPTYLLMPSKQEKVHSHSLGKTAVWCII